MKIFLRKTLLTTMLVLGLSAMGVNVALAHAKYSSKKTYLIVLSSKAVVIRKNKLTLKGVLPKISCYRTSDHSACNSISVKHLVDKWAAFSGKSIPAAMFMREGVQPSILRINAPKITHQKKGKKINVSFKISKVNAKNVNFGGIKGGNLYRYCDKPHHPVCLLF